MLYFTAILLMFKFPLKTESSRQGWRNHYRAKMCPIIDGILRLCDVRQCFRKKYTAGRTPAMLLTGRKHNIGLNSKVNMERVLYFRPEGVYRYFSCLSFPENRTLSAGVSPSLQRRTYAAVGVQTHAAAILLVSRFVTAVSF